MALEDLIKDYEEKSEETYTLHEKIINMFFPDSYFDDITFETDPFSKKDYEKKVSPRCSISFKYIDQYVGVSIVQNNGELDYRSLVIHKLEKEVEKIECFVIESSVGGGKLIVENFDKDVVESYLVPAEMAVGESFTITKKEITLEEFKNLKEFEGW